MSRTRCSPRIYIPYADAQTGQSNKTPPTGRGKVVEISFHQNETMTEADVDKMQAQYLYTNRGESWFAEEGNAKNRSHP